MLLLLTVVAAYNYIDRLVLSLVLEDIKQDLDLSDTQLGLLSGIAFSLFYSVAAIPIARWADRGNRNLIVSSTTALWSGMVILCGLVSSFAQLLIVRVGVAVGEAGCLPPAQSLIADYFSRKIRPKAMAVYWLCYPLAVIFGYLVGGWLADQFGWRITFIILGVPGILLALLVKLTLREPRFDGSEIINKSDHLGFYKVLKTLWKEKTFRRILIAFCVAYFFASGIFQWVPTFYIRSHGVELDELGTWFAFSWGLCGLLGGYLGGVITTKYAASKERLQMRAVALIFIASSLVFALICLTESKLHSFLFLSMIGVLANLSNGAIFSAIQSLVDEKMRSVSIALIFFLANLIGLGFGPLAVGLISDLLEPHFGNESLRYALVAFTPGYLWVAYHYWLAGETIEESIHLVESRGGNAHAN